MRMMKYTQTFTTFVELHLDQANKSRAVYSNLLASRIQLMQKVTRTRMMMMIKTRNYADELHPNSHCMYTHED